jgi:non-ribosomal peptide synthase protein (TIGR01720 family)
MLAYSNNSSMARTKNEIDLVPVTYHTKSAKFDLTLDILDDNKSIFLRWEYKTKLFNKKTIIEYNDEFIKLIEQLIDNDKGPLRNTGDKKENEINERKIIEEIFQSVLNIKDIDYSKGFLELGGDSIKAIRINSKLRSNGFKLEPSDILKLESVSNIFEKLGVNQKSVDKTSSIDSEIMKIFTKILNIEELDITKGFLELGGDSIKAIRIISKLRGIGIEYTAKELLSRENIYEIFIDIAKTKQMKSLSIESNSMDLESNVGCSIPIIDKFFEQNMFNENYFNQANIYRLNESYSIDIFNKIFNKIVEKHPILRCNFRKVKDKIFITQNSNLGYKLFYNQMTELDMEFIKRSCESIQKSFSIEKEPLFKISVFNVENKSIIFMCAHHMVIDGYSWRILIDDFLAILDSINNVNRPNIGIEEMNYLEWVEEIKDYANSDNIKKEIGYWCNINNKISNAKIVVNNSCKVKDFSQIKIILEEELTRKIVTSCSNVEDIRINDLLLTSLALSLNSVFKKSCFAINLESHGRELLTERMIIDETVGWFTSVYPAILEIREGNVIENLTRIKRILRKIPNNGVGYGIIRYVRKEWIDLIEPDISFNYLGDISVTDNMCVNSIFNTGSTIDKNNYLWSELNINCFIENGEMHIYYDFNKNAISEKNAELLIEFMKMYLYEIVSDSSHELKNQFDKLNNKLNDKKKIIELPLTAMQEGMLFHTILDDHSTDYYTQTTFKIIGAKVNYISLKKAIEMVSLKHNALSMSLKYDENHRMKQIVDPNKMIEVEDIELSADNMDIEEAVKQYKAKQLEKRFDLEEGNLFRVNLIKTMGNEGYMLINFHHAVLDGWSLPNLILTIKQYYNMINNLDLDLLYSDVENRDSYVKYMEYMLSQKKTVALKYWKELLSGYKNSASFDIIKQVNLDNSLVKSQEQSFCEIELSQRIFEKIKKVSSKLNVTKNTIFETVFGILLQKYTYTEDVVFGKVVSGRNYPVDRVDEIIGSLINTIPVRVNSDDKTTFSKLIKEIQSQAFDSEKNSFCSISEIQKLVEEKCNIINAVIVYENFFQNDEIIELDEGTFLKIIDGREKTNLDIAVSVCEGNSKFYLKITYDSNLFPLKRFKTPDFSRVALAIRR